MGKKKDKKKTSKKEQKRAIKESKKIIKDLFDKLGSGAPIGGVNILITPIPYESIGPDEPKDNKFISEESLK